MDHNTDLTPPTSENFPTVSTSSNKTVDKGREKDNTQFLPPGWKLELVLRQSGKTKGIYDKYWYSPEGKKFKSKVSVLRYLKENPPLHCPLEQPKSNDEGTIFFRNAEIRSGKRKLDDLSSSPPVPKKCREYKKSESRFSENSEFSVLSHVETKPKEDEWEVEAILDSRFNTNLGATQYCTLWADGSVTWEPAENFIDENGSQNFLFLEFIQSCQTTKSKNRNQKKKRYGYYGKDIVDNYNVEDEDYDPEKDKVSVISPVDDEVIEEDCSEILCQNKKNPRPCKKSHKKSPRKLKPEFRKKEPTAEKLPKKEPYPELGSHSLGDETFQNSFEIPVLETMSYSVDDVLSESSSFQIVESGDNSDTSEPRY